MMEFKAEISADHCQTTATTKKQALSEEWCSDFCLELCMPLPRLLLLPEGTMAEKSAKNHLTIIIYINKYLYIYIYIYIIPQTRRGIPQTRRVYPRLDLVDIDDF